MDTSDNILLLYYSFKKIPLQNENWIYYTVVLLIFMIIYYFANKNKNEVVNSKKYNNSKNNIIVVLIFLISFISFVFLANINREKIFKIKKENYIQVPPSWRKRHACAHNDNKPTMAQASRLCE